MFKRNVAKLVYSASHRHSFMTVSNSYSTDMKPILWQEIDVLSGKLLKN